VGVASVSQRAVSGAGALSVPVTNILNERLSFIMACDKPDFRRLYSERYHESNSREGRRHIRSHF